MEGGDAYKRLKKLPTKQYDESFASFIFCQTLKGLKFLHGQGVVHRDIKPENILLSDESAFPIAKIADFSLVETFQNKKMSVRCGTPGYMAPEMFSEESYCEKVDVFSLGVTLFIMYRCVFFEILSFSLDFFAGCRGKAPFRAVAPRRSWRKTRPV